MATNRGVLQATGPGCFFGLPFELRSQVYICASRQIGQLGCTKLLWLCSQTYAEAIYWFRCQRVAELTVTGNNKHIFRAPRDFGMPGRFMHFKKSTKCFVPQRYSKLQIMRMHKVVLNIVLTNTDHHATTRNALSASLKAQQLRTNMEDIFHVLRASEVKHLEITVWRDVAHREEPFAALLRNFMQTIADLTAEKRIEFKMGAEYNAGFPVEFADSANRFNPFTEGDNDADISISASQSDLFSSALSYQIFDPHIDIDWTTYRACEHHLVSECRFCLEPFGSKQALQRHLTMLPRHKGGFIQKHWNQLHPVPDQHGGARVCWTCAKSYESIAALTKHMDQKGHRRNGIIPRYVEDNDWYHWKNRTLVRESRSSMFQAPNDRFSHH